MVQRWISGYYVIVVNDLKYRYEYKNKKLWALSFVGVLFLFAMALISLLRGPSIVNISFAILFLVVTIAQVHAWIIKKIPFIEIDTNKIQWGYMGRKSKQVNFNDVSKIVLGHGIDDNDILIIERSGYTRKINQIFFYTETDKLQEVLYHHQAKYGYIIEKANGAPR